MARIETVNGERLMTAAEVGALFRVGPKAIEAAADAGKIRWLIAGDGEYRFFESEVYALLRGEAR